MPQFNTTDEAPVRIPDLEATVPALVREVKPVTRAATFHDGVFFRTKPDRRRAQEAVLPYRERRAVRR